MAYAFLNGIFGGCENSDDSLVRSLIDRSITEIEIPEGVKTIGAYAFESCRALVSAKIPDSVTAIKNYAFHDCVSLDEIVIPDSVTSLGVSCFHGCTGLERVDISDNITELPSNCFYQCAKIKEFVLPSKLATIQVNALACANCKVYDFTKCESVPALKNVNGISCSDGDRILVPASLYDEWVSAANWSAYTDYIEAVEGEKFGIIEPTKIYKDACSNGWENIKGLSFDEWKIDTPNEGYYIYGFPLRAGQVKLEVTGGILTSSFTLDIAKPNVFFVRGYNSENGGICVMDAPDVSVYPDNWLGSTIPEKVTIDIPEGLGIDGVYLSFLGNPVVESIDPNAEV